MEMNTVMAMEILIKEARRKIPFHLSFDGHCEGRCDECPEKFLEYLDIELLDWESKLKKGAMPCPLDVDAVSRMCKEVYSILEKRGLVQNISTVGDFNIARITT